MIEPRVNASMQCPPLPPPTKEGEAKPLELAPWIAPGAIVKDLSQNCGDRFAIISGMPWHDPQAKKPGGRFGALTPSIGIHYVDMSGHVSENRRWVKIFDIRRAAYSWRKRLVAAIKARRRTLKAAMGPWEVAAHEVGGSPEGAWTIANGYTCKGVAESAIFNKERCIKLKPGEEPLVYFARLSTD